MPSGPNESNLLIYKYGDQSVFVHRPRNFGAALGSARRSFPNIRGRIVLQTNELAMCKGQMIEITPLVWASVSTMVTTIYVSATSAPAPAPPPPPYQERAQTHPITLNVVYDVTLRHTIIAKPTTLMSRVIEAAAKRFGLSASDVKLYYSGAQVLPTETPAMLGLHGEHTMHLVPFVRG